MFHMFSYLILLTLVLSEVHSDVLTKSIRPSFSVFGSKIQNKNIEKAFDEKNAKRLSNPLELFLSTSNILIGLTNSQEIKYNINSVISYIQSYLDSVYHSKSFKELIILYESNFDEPNNSSSTVNRLNDIFNDLLKLFPDIILSNVKMTIIPISKTADKDTVNDALAEYLSKVSVHDSSPPPSASVVNPSSLANKNDDSILISPSKYAEIELNFILDFSRALAETTNSSVVPIISDKKDQIVPALSVITENSLLNALDVAIEKNYERYTELFGESYQKTYSLMLLSYRIRVKLVQMLHNLFRKSMENMKQSTLELFELNSRKTPTDSKFRSRLKKKANILIESFVTNCDTLAKAMGSVPTKTVVRDGLFNSILYQQMKLSFLSSMQSTGDESAFVYTYDVKTLQSQLDKLCDEKVDNGIIQGRYNPFIRSHPFPPLTLKFHYLFDPRSALYSRSYEKLYDEHKEGFATNRASSLYIPGVSIVPFNPNELPIAKENKAWWKVLKDFFNNEL